MSFSKTLTWSYAIFKFRAHILAFFSVNYFWLFWLFLYPHSFKVISVLSGKLCVSDRKQLIMLTTMDSFIYLWVRVFVIFRSSQKSKEHVRVILTGFVLVGIIGSLLNSYFLSYYGEKLKDVAISTRQHAMHLWFKIFLSWGMGKKLEIFMSSVSYWVSWFA